MGDSTRIEVESAFEAIKEKPRKQKIEVLIKFCNPRQKKQSQNDLMSDLQVMSMSFLAQQLAEDQQKQELIEELHSKLGFSCRSEIFKMN